MGELIAGLCFVLYGSGLALLVSRLGRKTLQSWQDAATSCGLRVEKTSGVWGRLWLEARDGPLTVRIEVPEGRKKYHCQIVVVIPPGPPGFSGVYIRREELKPSGAHEIEIGDEPFDKAFYILGPVRLLTALLDVEMRQLLMSVNAESQALVIVGGELGVGTIGNRIADLLPFVLDIARRCAQPLDVAQRLADNAHQDPDVGVRLRNLLVLAREFPGEPATTEALRTACADANSRVRLRAAQELGAEGRGVLLELAESIADDETSAQAVSSLNRELPVERTRALLLQALRRRLHKTARACLEVLGGSTAPEDVGTLAKVMVREHSELATAAATALGRTGNPAAEPPLIQALQSESRDLQVAAANALARIGTVAAVLPLKEAVERSARDPALLKATRQAIAEIQLRLPGASPGQLSLAGTEAGQLSLAQTEAGQLSLAEDPAGRLSLDGETA
ncbi:MAG TPA: HEAT repeat domain-containing protein [Thermoanaerobaculia bacterium]|nr:HEAT repeat domain-containing protein [Thermoanaerobaculia bacterium]